MNIKTRIEGSGRGFREVAAALFPNNAHPYNALLRVCNNESQLTARQAIQLSNILGVTIEDLVSGLTWKGTASPGGKLKLESQLNGWRADVNLETMTVKVSSSDGAKHEFVYASNAVSFTELVQKLNEVINELTNI